MDSTEPNVDANEKSAADRLAELSGEPQENSSTMGRFLIRGIWSGNESMSRLSVCATAVTFSSAAHSLPTSYRTHRATLTEFLADLRRSSPFLKSGGAAGFPAPRCRKEIHESASSAAFRSPPKNSGASRSMGGRCRVTGAAATALRKRRENPGCDAASGTPPTI